ncbi:type III-B CRISPR module-associated protein Cmr5 [Anaerostipes sp.]|uniref:type III-B CRISPR module-associated protein Cmr5 n=1 Tax=Anaerostipes sp. TaxID=1872530 RepID=UPI0025BCB2F8|nr:type III-B CRISPR module-associated protein Cmr5 [Anaerostipes sp.]MBS7007937.1 hypothetical protein [Anaerostipes sp.]
MNKRIIDQEISYAFDILDEAGIVKEDGGEKVILKGYKSQIAAFGASISMGSLISAVAFYNDKGNAAVDRTKLLKAIYKIINRQKDINDANQSLYAYIKNELQGCESAAYHSTYARLKEEVINAAIALKLAMNLYPLKDETEIGDNDEKEK